MDQRVTREVAERVDRPEPGEQRRAADREHVFVEQPLRLEARPLAGSVENGRVEIVTAEVERGPGRPEADFDLGVLAGELAEPRQQPPLQELARHAEIEHAADAFTPDALDGTGEFVEPAPHAREQFRAFLRERDGAGVTAEERHADVSLERLDLGAHGGRRDAEFARRGGEAQVRRDGLEHAQGVQRNAVRRGCHRVPSVNRWLTIRSKCPASKARLAALSRESKK